MKKYAGLIVALASTLLLTAIVVTPSVIEAARKSTTEKKSSMTTNYIPQGQGNTITVSQSVRNDTSPPLRDMKQLPIMRRDQREANENPKVNHSPKNTKDEGVQSSLEAPTANMPGT